MAFTVDHAKRMRAAYNNAGQAHRSDRPPGTARRASAVDASSIREAGKPRARSRPSTPTCTATRRTASRSGRARSIPDMTPENIIWNSFLGEAPKRAVRRQPLHQLALLLGLLGRQRLREHVPPARVLVQGAGPPDPESGDHGRRRVSVEGRPRSAGHHERRHGAPRGDAVHLGLRLRQQSAGISEDVLGTDGTHRAQGQQIRYLPQKVNRPDGNEMLGQTRSRPERAHAELPRLHPRRASRPNCPFDLGFRVSIACRMAVDSYRQGRTLRWDASEGRDRLANARRSSGPMDFAYSPEQLQLRKAVREFAESEIAPHVMEWDEAQIFPLDVIRQWATSATWAPSFPKNLAERASYIDYSIIIEELARRPLRRPDRRGAQFALHEPHLPIGHGRAAAQLYPEARNRRVDRLLVADGARGRVGRRRARAPPRSARRLLGAQWRKNVHHERALCRRLRRHGRYRPRFAQHGISAFIIEKDTPGSVLAGRRTSWACGPAPPAR